MFDFLRRRTAKEFIAEAKETYSLPETPKVPVMPAIKSEEKESKEVYRIGARPDGLTTITLMDSGGFSMTLSLNQSGCEQMIRMIRATYLPAGPEEHCND